MSHVLFAAFRDRRSIAAFRAAAAASETRDEAYDTLVRRRSTLRASRLLPWETDAASGMAKGALLGALAGSAAIGLSFALGVFSITGAALISTAIAGAVFGGAMGAMGGGLGGFATPAAALRGLRDAVDAPFLVTLRSSDATTHAELRQLVEEHGVALAERRLLGTEAPELVEDVGPRPDLVAVA